MRQFLIQKVRDVLFWKNQNYGSYLNEHLYSERKQDQTINGQNIVLSSLESSIIKTLLYFDIFSYPLTSSEIVKYCPEICPNGIGDELDHLCSVGLVGLKNDFYCLGNVSKADGRVSRNANAAKYMPLAIKYSKWIGFLPFVQSVCISGSLSKHDMGERADIDYFVIVDENRVWIIRFIFSLMIKPMTMIGLRNRFLCPNYIVDSRHLEIRDKNVYTATEIVSLIPAFGKEFYFHFMKANSWVKTLLPNVKLTNEYSDILPNVGLSGLGIWNMLDNFLFNIYKRHYKRKFYDSGKWKIEDFELKFNKFESKNHLNGYRNKILTKHDEGIARFEQNFGVTLR